MISVCLAVYNGEKYIKEQIDSILTQLDHTGEIIISDDNSTDKTLEIIENFSDSRIKIFRGNNFKSPIFNLENALKHAQGNYIFLADQDDVWIENKVQICMQYLQTADVVVSDCKVVDAGLNIMCNSFFQKNHSRQGFFINLQHNAYIGCCMAFRRKILTTCLPFPKNIPMHDIWLGFVAELFYTSCFIPLPLVLYRRHGNNISPTSQTSVFNFRQKLLFRWNLIRYIPLLLLRKLKSKK
jgi:glycosyltransferase involved in cell wall biosynthesis